MDAESLASIFQGTLTNPNKKIKDGPEFQLTKELIENPKLVPEK